MSNDGSGVPAARPAGRRAHYLATAAALVLGLAVTFAGWRVADRAVYADARRDFASRALDVRDAIRDRMATYAQVLRGAVGFFAASEHVERAEWRAYVDALRIEVTYPGIQALGVVERVSAPGLAEHEQRVRAEGFEHYAVHPRGARPEHYPVVYIEPLNERNRRALGFDLRSEAERSAALDRAVTAGEPVLSGKVTLVQETGVDVQPGIVMLAPVFRRGLPLDEITDRQSALHGFIYAPFRTRDLMRGLLGAVAGLRVEIFDGVGTDAPALLYDSAPPLSSALPQARFASTMQMIVQDHAWTLRVSSLPQFEREIDRRPSTDIAIAGAAISLMLTALVWLIMTSRERALRLAERMTRELRESRERLSLAMEGSNLATFDWDIERDRVRLSPRWNVFLGGAPEIVTTTSAGLASLIHPDDSARARQGLAATLEGETPFYQMEHRVRTHDGSWKWIASHAKVVERDESGRALRLTGVNADISERKAVEDLKNAFIGTVSHELRTPLTAIIGALGLLREEYGAKVPPDAAAFLDMAYQNSERLAALVNDILDLEKVEAGRLDLDIEPVGVQPLLEEAIALNAPYASRHGTRFDIDGPQPVLTVRADRARLMQVLTNLMSNAAKHSPPGQPVTLRASASDGRARIEVIDRGPGVPLAFRDRIFAKFAQADSTDTRSKGGTGLGLALSKAMTEAMDGEIGFESTPGAGATFYVTLPLA